MIRTVVNTCRRLVDSTRFEYTTMGVIIANAVVLGLETYDYMQENIGGLLDALNVVFLAYFVVEIVIRLTGHEFRLGRFFSNPWNAFDFVVIAAVFVPGVAQNATLLRVLRLLRVFRLVAFMPELRVLIQGVVRSLRPLTGMALLTFLLVYVYAMLGWILFEEQDPAHWNTLGRSMLTLFTILTLEGWPEVLDVAMQDTAWAWIYFVSFVLISAFVLVNMVIAVVINSVEDARASVAEEIAKAEHEQLMQEETREAALLQQVELLREAVEGLEREVKGLAR